MEIKLENFSGPFDLLLHLIDDKKLDIYSVSISRLTDDYLKVIEQLRENKLDVGSEFLLMATTLLELKSRSLLPAEIIAETIFEDEESRQSLLDRLVEYKMFKEASELLEKQSAEFHKTHLRTDAIDDYIHAHHITPKVELKSTDLSRLLSAFDELWKRYLVESVEEKEIESDTVTVRDRITFILDTLGAQRMITFESLFLSDTITRVEIIVTFLALLELVKRQLVSVMQEGMYDEIRLARNWGELEPLMDVAEAAGEDYH